MAKEKSPNPHMIKNETMRRVMGVWDEVLEDMEYTAEEYRDNGWSVIDLAPGDVTLTTSSEYDIDVLIPDNEFEEVLEILDRDGFQPTETDKYSAVANGLIIHQLVLKDPESKMAITFPIYFNEKPADRVVKVDDTTEPVSIGIRNLAMDFVLKVQYESYQQFFDDV